MRDAQTLDTLVSDVSGLMQTMSQIVSWIKRVEQSGVVQKGTWDSSKTDVLRLRLQDEIAEVKRLLNDIKSPELSDLLSTKLSRLEWERDSLE